MAAQPETAPPERAAWRRWSPFQNRASVRPAESSWQVPLSTKWGLAAARFQFVSMWVLSLGCLLHWVELEYQAHRDDGLVMRWAASYDFRVPFSLRWLNTSEEEFSPVTPNFREQGPGTQGRSSPGKDLHSRVADSHSQDRSGSQRAGTSFSSPTGEQIKRSERTQKRRRRVLVIGDSILRGTEGPICRQNPSAREVYCLPGAKIRDVME